MEELLAQTACKADYARWCRGDLRQADLVDKWGGEVRRTFQAWFMAGGGGNEQRGRHDNHQAPPEDATTMLEEMETMSYDAGEAGLTERRRRTGEAMARRRILHAKRDRRRVGLDQPSPSTDEGD